MYFVRLGYRKCVLFSICENTCVHRIYRFPEVYYVFHDDLCTYFSEPNENLRNSFYDHYGKYIHEPLEFKVIFFIMLNNMFY